jgi:hypothetical protein
MDNVKNVKHIYYPRDIEKDPEELEKCLKLAKKIIKENGSKKISYSTLMLSLANEIPLQKAVDIADIYFERMTPDE